MVRSRRVRTLRGVEERLVVSSTRGLCFPPWLSFPPTVSGFCFQPFPASLGLQLPLQLQLQLAPLPPSLPKPGTSTARHQSPDSAPLPLFINNSGPLGDVRPRGAVATIAGDCNPKHPHAAATQTATRHQTGKPYASETNTPEYTRQAETRRRGTSAPRKFPAKHKVPT